MLPPVRPNLALANNELIKLESNIKNAIQNINNNQEPENVSYWCKCVMKNIIHASFCLIMPNIGEYTRDIGLCAETAIKHHRSMARDIQQAARWVYNPVNKPQQLLDFLNGFGNRLILEVDRWMKYHNPALNRELPINTELDTSKPHYVPGLDEIN